MPRSDLISLIGLRRAMKRQSALEKESVSNELGDSRWIALLARQVNTTPYRFNSFRPSLMRQGQKRSTLQYVNGGAEVSRSFGKSAIFCFADLARNFLHSTHFEM